MIARGYAIFNSAIGRCGIAWSLAGVVGVQLPEAREIETRRRLYQLYPEARELSPPPNPRPRSKASLRRCAARTPISPT